MASAKELAQLLLSMSSPTGGERAEEVLRDLENNPTLTSDLAAMFAAATRGAQPITPAAEPNAIIDAFRRVGVR